jgi:hypothetical protein
MSETFKQAGKVISYFHHAPAQHALLRRYQVELYGKEMALLNSVATRWGSQYTMLQSINRTYKALCAWADKQEESGDSEITQIILDSSFRLRLEGVIGALEPFHQAQKRSEAQGFSVFEVVRQCQVAIARTYVSCRMPTLSPSLLVLCKLFGLS